MGVVKLTKKAVSEIPPPSGVTLYKYACGCVGFSPMTDNHALILRVCDAGNEIDAIGIEVRSFPKPCYEAISQEKTDRILSVMGSLIQYGKVWLDFAHKVRETV